ncbi:MAG: hypothetical protein K8823_1555 [Cenarchaeum symbiont of Oopsacas minuta]|nr:hypothetical protein [Cenarchaeum symbiont of Oopsacas minuta]
MPFIITGDGDNRAVEKTGTDYFTLDELVTAIGNNSTITPAHYAIREAYLDIHKFLNSGTFNLEANRNQYVTMSIDGGVAFGNDEFVNRGDIEIQGHAGFSDGIEIPIWNVTLLATRDSQSYFAQSQGAIKDLGLRFVLKYVKIVIASPIDFFTSATPAGGNDLEHVWILPFQRDDGFNPIIRYNKVGILKNVTFSTPISLFNSPAVITNPILKNVGGPLFMSHVGAERSGTSALRTVEGFSYIGTASYQTSGTPRVTHYNSQLGSETRITSVGNNPEKCHGILFYQRVKVEIKDIDGNMLKGVAIIRDHNSGVRPIALYYNLSYNGGGRDDPENFVRALWRSDISENKVYKFDIPEGRQSQELEVLQNVHWWNYTENPNFVPAYPTGEHDDFRGKSNKDNFRIGYYITGYEIKPNDVILRKQGDTLIISQTATRLPKYQHTEAQIANFTQYENEVKLYEGIRYLEMIQAEALSEVIGVGESLVSYEGNTLTIREGWRLILSDVPDTFLLDTNLKLIEVYVEGVFYISNGQRLIVNGVLDARAPIRGIYQYLKQGIKTNSHHLKPLVNFNSEIKYFIEIFQNHNDGTQTQIYSLNSDDLPQYIEIEDGASITLHAHGGGVSNTNATYDPIPDLIEPTLTLDGEPGLVQTVQAKLEAGEYVATITKDGDVYTLNLGGTESMEDVISEVLYLLADGAVSKYNQGKPSDERITTNIIMETGGTVLTMHALFGSLNSLKFNGGAAIRIILNDGNVDLLTSHDFGINVQTSTKFLTRSTVKAGDTIKINNRSVVEITEDGTYDLVLNIGATNRGWIKRDWVDTTKHTFTVNNPNYVPVELPILGLDVPPLIDNKYLPIGDYLTAVGDKILHKKSTVNNTDSASIENPYHLRLLNDFDKTFPFGLDGLHTIKEVRPSTVVLNYEPIVNQTTTTCTPAVYYENAAISNGQNADGTPNYDSAFIVEGIGGNFEIFQVDARRAKTANNTYNEAGAMFNSFVQNTDNTFYLVRANGSKRKITPRFQVFSNNAFHFELGKADFDLRAGEHVTFLKSPAITNTEYEVVRVALQIKWDSGGNEEVATQYINSLTQTAINVTSGADIKDVLNNINMDTSDLLEYQNNYSERILNPDGSVNFKIYKDNTRTELLYNFLVTKDGDVQKRDRV